MSKELVTRAELQETLQKLEKRLEAQRTAFENRLEAQVKKFMTEVNGHIVRIAEEGHEGRRNLIDSNQAIVTELKRTQERTDRAEEGASRHRESTAARLLAMEDGFRNLNISVVEAITDLGKQINAVKGAVDTLACRQ